MRLTKRKIKKGSETRVFTEKSVIDAIAEHRKIHNLETRSILCHGVRFGGELKFFEEAFPDAKILGTEITPEACDGVRVINRDFAAPDKEWIGKIDLIYSNSYDHALDPWVVIKAWVSCLSPGGRVYVEWTPWHNKLGTNTWKADCFAADDLEYQSIFRAAGRLDSVLFVESNRPKGNFTREIFVVH